MSESAIIKIAKLRNMTYEDVINKAKEETNISNTSIQKSRAILNKKQQYEKPLTYACKHCGKVFLSVGRYQKGIFDQLKNGEIVLNSKKRCFYPNNLSDSQKLHDIVLRNNDEHHFYIRSDAFLELTKENDFESYRYSLLDFEEYGLIEHDHFERFSNVGEDEKNDKGELSFGFDVDATDKIRFSKMFLNYEKKYGQVYFMTFDEDKANGVCPICGTKEYKENIILADHPAFIYAYQNKKKELCWYSLPEILENNYFRGKSEYIDKLVDNKRNDLKLREKEYVMQQKADTFDLRKYIDALVLCEQAINVIEEEYKSAVEQYATNEFILGKKEKSIENTYIYEIKNQISNIQIKLDELKKPVMFSESDLADLGIIKPLLPHEPVRTKNDKPIKPVKGKSNIFTKSRVDKEYEVAIKEYEFALREYELASEQYEKELLEYNSEVKKYEMDLEAYNNSVKELQNKRNEETEDERIHLCSNIDVLNSILDDPNSSIKKEKSNLVEYAFKDVISTEIADIEEELLTLYDNKNKLLSMGVLYPKYDNLVALTRFQEYFLTGRCQELEGADGAYNLFENEYRADLIINKLDDISEKLDQIKENQYQLYYVMEDIQKNQMHLQTLLSDAFNEITENLETIAAQGKEANAYLANISKNTKLIEYNTARTAYYTKKCSQILPIIALLTV